MGYKGDGVVMPGGTGGGGFRDRVYRAVQVVPPGRVAAYSDIAALVGGPRLARQVGWALAGLGPSWQERHGLVPWHRVIRASGQIALAGDPDRAERQRALLLEEGVEVDHELKVEMARFRWRPVAPPPGPAPGYASEDRRDSLLDDDGDGPGLGEGGRPSALPRRNVS